ncbi:MAG: hypothetical protein GWP61_28170 [Chloroflexi bacterium]|jgi:hypothetical protein|nr:hypothetical protein [Chloroflexota bacterium]
MSITIANDQRTRVAVLGTVAEFHEGAISFDMSNLLELVASINPDLLCLDITPQQWREREFDVLPPDYRDALLPLARQTDIVVAPIGGEIDWPAEVVAGWRIMVTCRLRSWISAIQRRAPSPEALNRGWRHELVNTLYYATRRLTNSDRRGGARAHADYLTEQVLAVSQRDPGARLLVVVNVQYCHLIRERLRKHGEVMVTGLSEL